MLGPEPESEQEADAPGDLGGKPSEGEVAERARRPPPESGCIKQGATLKLWPSRYIKVDGGSLKIYESKRKVGVQVRKTPSWPRS